MPGKHIVLKMRFASCINAHDLFTSCGVFNQSKSPNQMVKLNAPKSSSRVEGVAHKVVQAVHIKG